ncbi:hypothetical protein GN958_ATG08126 [Phytophthora infestans]|uniref:Uncharacterized protein n=1 Tax=Phytophthora infestans TaxID=4787 RepID=A0A8S9UTP5_PHYIN|nr:hypothetical protein GN958_ATG08126 [Phytophthora infestans]
MLFYCRNIDEFITDFPNLSTQKTWVGRFIARYATPGILNLARETVSNETDSTSNAAAGTTQPSRLLPSTVDSLGLCNIPGQSSTSTCDPDRPLESNQEFDGAVNEMVEVDEDAHGPNMLTDQEVATEGADTIEVGAAKSPSLALLNSSFSTALTYQTATLCEKFEVFRFFRTPKISAYILNTMSAAGILRPEEVAFILPWTVIRRCEQRVTALQRKTKGLSERDVCLEIGSVGILTTSTLAAMKLWHKATKAVSAVKKTINWIPSIDFSTTTTIPEFHVTREPSLVEKLLSAPLFAAQVPSRCNTLC